MKCYEASWSTYAGQCVQVEGKDGFWISWMMKEHGMLFISLHSADISFVPIVGERLEKVVVSFSLSFLDYFFLRTRVMRRA